MKRSALALFLVFATAMAAQEPSATAPAAQAVSALAFTVAPGTRVPLIMVNSISTRTAQEGDQLYLETAFPVVVNQKIVIPPGSYVKGTVTQVKRPGRMKGRGEVYIRFDTLTLPNGVTRDFRGRVGAVDGSGSETLEKKEGKIQGDTAKGADAETIATTAGYGTSIGVIAGAAGGRPGMGTAVGAAAGAAAGLVTVLLTRGPDVRLFRGTELDMVLDRTLAFTEEELKFEGPTFRSSVPLAAPAASRDTQRRGVGFPVPYPR